MRPSNRIVHTPVSPPPPPTFSPEQSVPLALLLMGPAVIAAAALIIPWVVQAQSQEASPTAGATWDNPPSYAHHQHPDRLIFLVDRG